MRPPRLASIVRCGYDGSDKTSAFLDGLEARETGRRLLSMGCGAEKQVVEMSRCVVSAGKIKSALLDVMVLLEKLDRHCSMRSFCWKN